MKKSIGTIFGFLGVIAGIIAIFRFVADTEIAIGFITLSFGILAIIWTSMALTSLSKGSSLKKHTFNFLLCLIFIMLFSIWYTISKLLKWRETINEPMLYPGYLFLTLAFLIFVATSYQILTMGHEFGFEKQAEKIQKVIESKKKKLKSK